jgi:hypothetical protein
VQSSAFYTNLLIWPILPAFRIVPRFGDGPWCFLRAWLSYPDAKEVRPCVKMVGWWFTSDLGVPTNGLSFWICLKMCYPNSGTLVQKFMFSPLICHDSTILFLWVQNTKRLPAQRTSDLELFESLLLYFLRHTTGSMLSLQERKRKVLPHELVMYISGYYW